MDDGLQMNLYHSKPTSEVAAAVIVLGEIFGLDAYLKDVCDRFASESFHAFAPALLNRIGHEAFDYSDESAAHEASTNRLSPSQAVEDVMAVLRHLEGYESVSIVGFSYGATLAWLAACEYSFHYMCGFYGNRIAYEAQRKPKCEFDLFFAKQDQGFTSERRLMIAEGIDTRNVHLVDAQHGFDCRFRPDTFDQTASHWAFSRCVKKMKGTAQNDQRCY